MREQILISSIIHRNGEAFSVTTKEVHDETGINHCITTAYNLTTDKELAAIKTFPGTVRGHYCICTELLKYGSILPDNYTID